MREKTSCFTGLRYTGTRKCRDRKRTRAAIVSLIGKGVIYYGAGGARGV